MSKGSLVRRRVRSVGSVGSVRRVVRPRTPESAKRDLMPINPDVRCVVGLVR